MKTCVLAAFAMFVSFYNSSFSQGTWTLDASHSRLGFKATHMGISETHGSFDKVTCTITTSNNNDFTDAVFDLTAETSSINTGLEARDNHLKSEDFFSVSKFPTLSFKSTSCKKVKGKKYLIKGNLSMHGVTKEVLIIATHNGNTKNRGGMDMAGFKFTSSFKRSDFGIGTELPFSIVADQVELSSDMELVKN